MSHLYSKLTAFIFAAMSILLMACENNIIIDHYKSVPIKGWSKNDTVSFSIDTIRQNATYAFSVGLRSTAQYQYSDLWLIVECQFTNPDFSRKDTIECLINDRKNDSAQNGTFIHNHCYTLPPLPLKEGQCGKITVRHFMYNDELCGLSDIGIKINQ